MIGVMPRQMNFPMGFSEIWVPLATNAVRSARGDSSIHEGRKQLEAVARQLELSYPDSNKDLGVWVTGLAEQISSGPRQAIVVLWTAVGFALLICCANLANLMLARAVHRSREFAIRQAVGATRWHLLRQVLTESTLLFMTGGSLGLVIAASGIDLLSASVPPILLPMGGISLNKTVLFFTIGISVGTGLLFELLPALRTLRSQAAAALLEGGRAIAGGHSRNQTVNVLVIGEVAIAVMLLGSAGLLVAGMPRLQGAEMA